MSTEVAWVDFKLIRSQVGIIDVLRHYGLVGEGSVPEQIKITCPWHEDTKPSLSVNTLRNAFKCFGRCKRHGGILQFVAFMEGIEIADKTKRDREAGKLIQEWFEIVPERNPATSKKDNPQAGTVDVVATEGNREVESVGMSEEKEGAQCNHPLETPETYFRKRDLEHSYLLNRMVSPETSRHFEIGHHAGKGMYTGRIVIPIHNSVGQLVGFAGRWAAEDVPEKTPKYLFPPKFLASHELYNVHRVFEAGVLDELIVVEGFFDVFALWQEGIENVVAIMGSSLSMQQENALLRAVADEGRIVLAFDDDVAGYNCTIDALGRLSRHAWVKSTTAEELLEWCQASAS